jgi:hypothetical protein
MKEGERREESEVSHTAAQQHSTAQHPPATRLLLLSHTFLRIRILRSGVALPLGIHEDSTRK